MQSRIGRGIILLSVEQRGSQQIIKVTVVGRLGDLCVGRADGLIELFLREIGIHQPAETVARVLVLVESLLVELLRVRKVLLRQLDVAQLNVEEPDFEGPSSSPPRRPAGRR